MTDLSVAAELVADAVQHGYELKFLHLQAILYRMAQESLKAGKPLFSGNFVATHYGPQLDTVSLHQLWSAATDAETSSIVIHARRYYPCGAELLREAMAPESLWTRIYRDGAGVNETMPLSQVLEAAS